MAKVVPINGDAGSLADRAYEEIKKRIFDFAFMPGDRLSESELAHEISVSRTPLRQALHRLQHEGFVEAIPKVGWQVPALDFAKFDELYEFRVLIECHAAQAACAADHSRPALQKLSRTWQIPPEDRSSHPAKVGELDEAFHRQIVECAGNAELIRAHREITERMRIVRRLDFHKPDRVASTYEEHASILAAIHKGRREEAQRLLRAHIEQSRIEVRKITLEMLFQARNRNRTRR